MSQNSPLEADCFYHIYNRGINGENLFKQERNYKYFLEKYMFYLSPVVDTYASCLLKNHFHLLIRIKEQNVLNDFYKNLRKSANHIKHGLHSTEFIVSKQFARLFSCFTQSINKTISRTGPLVESPFRRIKVSNDNYLSRLIWYIHYNWEKHGFVKNFREYPHSSYVTYLNNTFLKKREVLDWLGGVDAHEDFHQSLQMDEGLRNLLIEVDY